MKGSEIDLNQIIPLINAMPVESSISAWEADFFIIINNEHDPRSWIEIWSRRKGFLFLPSSISKPEILDFYVKSKRVKVSSW